MTISVWYAHEMNALTKAMRDRKAKKELRRKEAYLYDVIYDFSTALHAAHGTLEQKHFSHPAMGDIEPLLLNSIADYPDWDGIVVVIESLREHVNNGTLPLRGKDDTEALCVLLECWGFPQASEEVSHCTKTGEILEVVSAASREYYKRLVEKRRGMDTERSLTLKRLHALYAFDTTDDGENVELPLEIRMSFAEIYEDEKVTT